MPFAIEAAKLDVLNWHFYLTLRKSRGILIVRKSKLCNVIRKVWKNVKNKGRKL